jgi:hypothetical protein
VGLVAFTSRRGERVPGRETDAKDSEWLAQLLECGLLFASIMPPPAMRELRDLTRYRVQQVRDRSQEVTDFSDHGGQLHSGILKDFARKRHAYNFGSSARVFSVADVTTHS